MDYLGDAAIRREIGKLAISAARTRLGADVMHYLAEQALTPLAQPQSACAFYRGLRIVSIDGTTLEVADEVGKPGSIRRAWQRARASGLPANSLCGTAGERHPRPLRRGAGRLQRFGSELGAPCATAPQTGHVVSGRSRLLGISAVAGGQPNRRPITLAHHQE